MKKHLILLATIPLLPSTVKCQSSADYTLQIKITIRPNPPAITFQWPQDTSSISYSVSRKTVNATGWTILNANLADTATTFTDSALNTGDAYEYRFAKFKSGYTAFTYTYSGIEAPAAEYRGKMILLVDSVFSGTLSSEISTLIQDLEGDGWNVIRYDVSRTETVPAIKNIIVSEYIADPQNVRSIYLLGHVPVPYSGAMNPDGHGDHYGAWPADVYYAEVNNQWTDISVNATTATRTQNINVPGDGKFDQSALPGPSELEIGRVDFYNLPLFTETETDLMKNYLDKAHAYRHKFFSVRPRALVDDNFGTFGGEAFGSNGWRLSSLLGPDSVSATDYFGSLAAESYQWSYGCGGGTYTSCGGVGNSNDFASDSVQTIFTMLFGSYFGDWDSQNNFMRSSLVSGTTLTCSWSGRPHWHYHRMGLGETTGHSAWLTQNNNSLYVFNFPARGVHTALMGDPALRMHVVAPASALSATALPNDEVLLNWNPSPDSIAGYYVYRKDSANGVYSRISPGIVAGTTFTDSSPVNSLNRYMVRAVRLENSASGTYYNLSQGVTDTLTIWLGGNEINNDITVVSVYPNPSSADMTLQFVSATASATSLLVTDQTGRFIFRKNCQVNYGLNQIVISVSGLAPGIYFVSLDETSFCKFAVYR